MTMQELDERTREVFQKLRAKCKNEAEVGRAIDSAIDFYFENKIKVDGQYELLRIN